MKTSSFWPRYITDVEVKLYEDGTLYIVLPHEYFCNADRILTASNEKLESRTFYEEGSENGDKENKRDSRGIKEKQG